MKKLKEEVFDLGSIHFVVEILPPKDAPQLLNFVCDGTPYIGLTNELSVDSALIKLALTATDYFVVFFAVAKKYELYPALFDLISSNPTLPLKFSITLFCCQCK
jgi:hypothetical protein